MAVDVGASGISLNPFDGLSEEEEEEEEDGDVPHSDLPLLERPAVEQVQHHWEAVDEVVRSKAVDPFTLTEFQEHLGAIAKLLIWENPEASGRTGDCLAFLLSENVVESVYLFVMRQRVYGRELRVALLRFFTDVFARSSQPVLIHQQILRPLSRLLRTCEGTTEPDICGALVPLLHRICILMQENQSLLDLFFVESHVPSQSKFLIFTQLIPHMHVASDVGNRARDAILLVLSLADQLPASTLSRFIATDCNFCQVLATGLSGLYSDLPTSHDVNVHDWQSLLPAVEAEVAELRPFIIALDFCNSVLQMAPTVVCHLVLSIVRDGFLRQVLGAALLQEAEEAVLLSTAYLCIFLGHITNIPLMREFLRFITVGTFDGRSLINALLLNISSSNEKLCSVTLELFYILVDLNCEDVMIELVFKHLLPGRHVLPNQLAVVSSYDVYAQAAKRFLQLLPIACVNAEKLLLESVQRSIQPSPEESETTPPCTVSPEKPTLNHLAVGRAASGGVASTNPFDSPATMRSRSGSNGSTSSTTSLGSVPGATPAGSAPPPQTNASPAPRGTGEVPFRDAYHTPKRAYLDNLGAARDGIHSCALRCRGWANGYDGCEVSKEELREREMELERERERERVKALEMEDIEVRVTPAEEAGDSSVLSLAGFRPRSSTLSHPAIARSSSARVSERLRAQNRASARERVREVAAITAGEKSIVGPPSIDPTTLSVSPGVSPRSSPRLGRKFTESILNRFDDNTGLLLKVVFEKLSSMLELSPTVNVLLTRLVCRLAHYPHPLLRSLLLNHQLVLRPGVPNLLGVLQSIKVTIDRYARTQDGFETRLGRARKTMIYSEQFRNSQLEESLANQIVSAEVKRLALVRQSSLVSELGDPSLGASPSPKKHDSKKSSEIPLPSISGSVAPADSEFRRLSRAERAVSRKRRKKVPTSTLFAIVIFDEFLKELAALSQEHSALVLPLVCLPRPFA